MELLRNTYRNKRKSESVIYRSSRIIKVSLGILTQNPWTTIYCQRDIKFWYPYGSVCAHVTYTEILI